MYSKEEIVAEIRRVAAYLKTDTVTPAQFQECSTIPLNTVEFFMGSWKSALLEALLSGVVRKEPTSKDLLTELWRIFTLTGEIPTYALIDQYGKIPSATYQQHWRSLEVPFKLAQRYFGEKKQEQSRDGYLTDAGRTRMFSGSASSDDQPDTSAQRHDANEDSQDLDAQLAATVVSAPVPEFVVPVVPVEEVKAENEPDRPAAPEESDRTLATWPEGEEGILLPEYNPDIHTARQPIIVPDLSNEPPPEQRMKGERLSFRGLQFPPSDRTGVIFLFGMVAIELGFFLETAGEGAGFNGFRTHRLDETEWSTVRLVFVHHSSELIGHEAELEPYTHVVCWEHDWSQCPLSVLGLSTLIRELPNYQKPK